MHKLNCKNPTVLKAVQDLIKGNAMQGEGKKLADAAKQTLKGYLSGREVDVDALKVGELVCLQHNGQDAISIEIGTRKGVDLQTLQSEYPDIYNKVNKDNSCVYYKPNKSFVTL